MGLVVRDSEGVFLASFVRKLANVFSPLQAEAMAVHAGLAWTAESGFQNFIFENDSLQITSPLLEPSSNSRMVGPTVEDAKALLRLITGVTPSHVYRQANGVAHCLDRIALQVDESCVGLGILL
ncbi:uncharacterized protein [Pyrus communis]|uniref:uncharacterized protein n=1 Tax=Pyrus communis TaxID=23211 RepID=UPI0035C116F6